jgi:hypothetical protein
VNRYVPPDEDLVLANLLAYKNKNFVFIYNLLILKYQFQWPGGLRLLACRGCGFESHWGHGCFSVVGVVCCHVEVSATS